MSSIFGSTPKGITPAAVVRMPDQKAQEVKGASEERRRMAMSRGGRDSTNLTGTGTGTYINDALGK